MDYTDKKKLLFDSLISAEECIKGTNLEQAPAELQSQYLQRHDASKDVSKRYYGKESIFKRPAAPISKCLKPRQAPDYTLNPHKWKKYSLLDADISDRTNTSAAFAFLAEIEKTKQSNSDGDEDIDGETSDKVVFKNRKKPTFSQSATLKKAVESPVEEDAEKAVLKGSKLVMPEYVIGRRTKSKNKKRPMSTSVSEASNKDASAKKKQMLQLQHLLEDDDDE